MIFGVKLAGVGGGILALLFGSNKQSRKKEKEKQKAKKEADQAEQDWKKTKKENDEKISEAGEDIESENYNNADDARSGINDFLNGDS